VAQRIGCYAEAVDRGFGTAVRTEPLRSAATCRRGTRQKGGRLGGKPRTSLYNGCNGAKPELHTANLFCEFRMGHSLEIVYFQAIPLGALA
jgi:hypothetical protein